MSEWAESGPDPRTSSQIDSGESAASVQSEPGRSDAGSDTWVPTEAAGAGAPPSGPPHTGDRMVDEALESLAELAGRPVQEQVEVYVGVHRRLQDRLADLDG